MTSKAQKNASKRYDKKNTIQIKLKFNKKTDGDIVEKISAVKNKQGYIKRLIRDDISKGS